MQIFFIMTPLLYIAGNIYIYCKLWRAMQALSLFIKISASALFWFVAFALFTAIAARDAQIPDFVIRALYKTGSLWMIFIFYTAALTLLLDIVSIFITAIKNSLYWAVGATILLLLYGYYNHRNPQIVPLEITIDKPLEKEMKIAVISDIHLGQGTGRNHLKKFIDIINSNNPDAILIAGDLVDNSLIPLYKEEIDKELLRLNAPMGVYMSPGNHEYISGIEECKNFLSATPIKLLCDSIVTLDNGVHIICRDDRSNKHRQPLDALYARTNKKRPIILIDHQPYNLAQSDSIGIDLQVSGHTHHGQVWPGSLITDLIYEQSHGYRQWKHTHIWVSSGVSLWGPPIRIGTKGDIAIITLKGKSTTQSNA